MAISENVKSSRMLNSLRLKLQTWKMAAENKRNAENTHKEASADALTDLLLLDGENGDGVRFEFDGKEYAAFACKPSSEWVWDLAPLVEYLRERKLLAKVSVTVVDPEKLESEMAAGNINRKDLEKFQVEKERAAYVKLINPKPESK